MGEKLPFFLFFFFFKGLCIQGLHLFPVPLPLGYSAPPTPPGSSFTPGPLPAHLQQLWAKWVDRAQKKWHRKYTGHSLAQSCREKEAM